MKQGRIQVRDLWWVVLAWWVIGVATAFLTMACAGPDTIGLGYGQSFPDTPGAPFTRDDEVGQWLGLNVSWQLKPARIEWVEPAPEPLTEDNIMDLIDAQEPAAAELEAPIDPEEVLDNFILLHPWVQIVLVIATVVLVFAFRAQLGRLLARVIGNGGNGKAKK